MKTKKIKIEELKPYLNNAKLHPNNQIEQLKKSIKDYGYIAPVIVDKDYNIIAGHGRYQALKELDYEEVEVVIVDNLSEEDINDLDKDVEDKVPGNKCICPKCGYEFEK